MNYGIIVYILGRVLEIEGVFLTLPVITALIYGEYRTLAAFLAVECGCLLVGLLCKKKKPSKTAFYAREGFVAVSLSWIFMSMVGALPFVLSGDIPSYTDALFETVSGFTTTGASILSNVEGLSNGCLFWRSFTHWLGGMGVLVLLLAILPLAGNYNMYLMKAESPGPSVGKLVPKVKSTAMILYGIYVVMTLVQIVLLLLTGMPVFDSLTISFGTAGTGGFGILNDSIASYNVVSQAVITIFMILFGVNFNVYFLIYSRKFRQARACEEMRWYFFIILAAVVLITANIRTMFPNLFEAFHHAAFQVGSIITTTGFSTVDFDRWPEFSKTILVGLMFIGACAGSTGGGIKVSRFLVMCKAVRNEVAHVIHPRSVCKISLEGRCLDKEVLRSIQNFLIAYCGIFALSVLIVSLDNFGFTTNFTAVAATINNIGPGLEMVGPSQNFGLFSPISKYVLMFDMLVGRLEIFPLLVLLSRKTWKK